MQKVRRYYFAPVALLSLAFILSAAQTISSALDTEFVAVSSNKFTPVQTTINVGDTVQWGNEGGLHNVNADDGSFRNGDPSTAPWTYNKTFNTPGTFQYYCEIHGGQGGVGMSGTIIVQGEPPVLDQLIYLPAILKQ